SASPALSCPTRCCPRQTPGACAAMVPARPKRYLSALEPELLQQLVDVWQVHQDLSRLAALVGADHTVLGELVHDPTCPGVADVDLALDQRARGAALGCPRTCGSSEQRIQPPLRPALLAGHVDAGVQHALQVSRLALALPEAHQGIHLPLRDECALQTN